MSTGKKSLNLLIIYLFLARTIHAIQDAKPTLLSGTWVVDSLTGSQAQDISGFGLLRISFEANRIVVSHPQLKEKYDGTYQFDSTFQPQRLTFEASDSTDRKRPVQLRAVVETLDSDSLRIFWEGPGDEYPKDFKPDGGEHVNWFQMELSRETKDNARFSGKVVRVVDGDTIEIQKSDNSKLLINLNGIDAPENGQPSAKDSRAYLSFAILEKQVFVIPHGSDSDGHTIGDVFSPTIAPRWQFSLANVGLLMMEFGHAWHDVRSAAQNKEFADAQKYAKERGRALWADASPIAPWDWRKQEADKKKAGK